MALSTASKALVGGSFTGLLVRSQSQLTQNGACPSAPCQIVSSTREIRPSFSSGSLLCRGLKGRGEERAKPARRWRTSAVSEETEAPKAEEVKEAEQVEGAEEAEDVPEEESDAPEAEDPMTELLRRYRQALVSDNLEEAETVEGALRALKGDSGETTKELTKEIDVLKDRYLRLNADFDNFRKRSDREKSSLASSVRGDVIEELLPMIDNFERARDAVKATSESEQKIDAAYQGIYRQFVDILKKLGIVPVPATGTAFDPAVHEAIMQEESTEYAEGIIIQEFRKGFKMGEQLLRPAMVKVSSGPGPASKKSGSE